MQTTTTALACYGAVAPAAAAYLFGSAQPPRERPLPDKA